MRKLLLALILIFRITYGYSQDYVDTIAGVACKCLDKIPDTISREQYNIKLGLCILEAS